MNVYCTVLYTYSTVLYWSGCVWGTKADKRALDPGHHVRARLTTSPVADNKWQTSSQGRAPMGCSPSTEVSRGEFEARMGILQTRVTHLEAEVSQRSDHQPVPSAEVTVPVETAHTTRSAPKEDMNTGHGRSM